MLNLLICNYYERFGNFNGILDTCIGDMIRSAADAEGKEYEEYCFSVLGYSTSTECLQESKRAMYERVSWLTREKDSRTDETDAIATKYGKLFSTKRFIEEDVTSLSSIGVQLGNYYMNSRAIVDGVPMSIKLNLYLSSKMFPTANVMMSECTAGQVEIVFGHTGCPCIQGQKMYLNLTEEEAKEAKITAVSIQKEAFKHVRYCKRLLRGCGIHSISEFVGLQYINNAKYLLLLDTAAAYCMTYNQFLEYTGVGLRSIDGIKVYENTGLFMFTVLNKVFWARPVDKYLNSDLADESIITNIITNAKILSTDLNKLEAFV